MFSSANPKMRPTAVYPVEPFKTSHWPQVSTLLGSWPFKPFAGHANWPPDKLKELCLARATETLEGARAWQVASDDDAVGLASLTRLPWDSRHLRMSAARLDFLVAVGAYDEQYQTKKALITTVLEYSKQSDIQHISARLDASDLSGLHLLEDAGFLTVDAILTFALDLSGSWRTSGAVINGSGLNTRLATEGDCEALADLARTVYVYDRFHADPSIASEQAGDLHAEWLRNSCLGKAADAVVLAEDAEGLLGFVTCKLQRDTKAHLSRSIGTIVLVATAERARGRGVGRAATYAALDWFLQRQTDIVEVGTQLRNIAASRLYQSCGFRLASSSVSLRKIV